MKKIAFSALFVAAVFTLAFAREGFTTTFSFPEMADSTKIVLRIHDSEAGYQDFRFDTIQVIGGQGVYSGTVAVDYPVPAWAFTPSGTFPFYLSNGQNEKIAGSGEDIKNLTLTYSGAPWSNDVMQYNRRVDAPRNVLGGKMGNFKKLTKAQRDSITSAFAEIEKSELELHVQLADSWISLYKTTYDMMNMPRENVQTVYDRLSPDKRSSRYGEILGRFLSVKPIEIGALLSDYDIEGTDQFGKPFRLSQVKEPYIILDFSQYGCGPCRMAAKDIAGLKGKYEGKVAFVNYSCDDTEQGWRKAVKRDSISWPSVFDNSGSSGDVSLRYGVNSYPKFFVFGPDRKLLKVWSGYGPGMLEYELPKLLKQDGSKPVAN